MTANPGSSDKVSVLLGQGDGTFQPQVSYAAGRDPQSVALGDLNRDGHIDVVTANLDDGNYDYGDVSVLLGRGDGTFQTQVKYQIGPSPSSLALGDINNDGRLDLMAANSRDASVSLLLGRGDGTFQRHGSPYSGGESPASVTVGDFNSDGHLDLVTATLAGVSILLARGGGTFEAAVSYPIGRYPDSVTVGDFNGDGHADLVTANSSGFDISVLLGRGDGTFAALVAPGEPPAYPAGNDPVFVALGDVNGDERLDVVAANGGSGGKTVSVLLGREDGSFAPPTTVGVGFYPQSVAWGDFNADGRLDFVTANSGTAKVSVLLGHGDGTFEAQVTYPVGDFPQAVAVGDLNGDDRLDLVTANTCSWNSSISVLLGRGDGTFERSVDYAAGAGPRSIVVGDVDGDGSLDLIAANSTAGDVSVLLGRGDGTFQSQMAYPVGSGPRSLAAGDLNGDGVLDLVTANSSDAYKHAAVLLGRGDGTFQAATTYAVGRDPWSAALGDVNGDGRLDLLVTNSSGLGNALSVLLGRGDGTFEARITYGIRGGAASFALGDVDGDRRLDVVRASVASDSVSVLLGRGTGTFWTRTAPVHFTAVFSEPVSGFTADDIQLDGTAPGRLVATVTPLDATSYDVAVSGLTGDGTVTATVRTNAALDAAGNPSWASTSTDNVVQYDVPPTVRIEQPTGQADPTRAAPVHFTIVFSEPVTGFTAKDVLLGGTAPGTLIAVVTPLDATSYDVAVSGMTGSGTVTASVPVGAATDARGHENSASTSNDNRVLYDADPPTVSINQATGQADPADTAPIHFTAMFSEPVTGFTAEDVVLGGTTTGQHVATVMQLDATTYDVSVSGMTGDGTLTAIVAAGAAWDGAGHPSLASTSTDPRVHYSLRRVLAGFVYADVNNNGVKDAAELGLPNVPVTISGPITRTIITGTDGAYRFEDLPSGKYTVSESQPRIFDDGRDTLGTPASGTVENDRFVDVEIAGPGDWSDYNFGELGLRAEFISLRFLFSSAPSHAELVQNLDLAQGVRWFAFQAATDALVTLSVGAEAEGLALEIYTDQFLPVVLGAGQTSVQAAVAAGFRYLVHVAGEVTPATSSARVTIAPVLPDSSQDTVGNWTNLLDRYDINADGQVSPQDVLAAINELNRTGPRLLQGVNAAPPYLDVTRDLLLTPLDVLLVICYLNQAGLHDAEGEGGNRGSKVGTGDSDSSPPFAYSSEAANRFVSLGEQIALSRVDTDSPQMVKSDLEILSPKWFPGPRAPGRDGELRKPAATQPRIGADRTGLLNEGDVHDVPWPGWRIKRTRLEPGGGGGGRQCLPC